MKNIFLLLILTIFFTACSIKSTTFNTNKYLLKNYNFYKSKKSFDNSLYINSIKVNKVFNKSAIFYSNKKYQLKNYIKNSWSNLPSNMIKQELQLAFEKSNLFNKITTNDTNSDFTLNTKLFEIYNKIENNSAYSILSISFEIVNNTNKKTKKYFYEKKTKLKKNTPYSFITTVNRDFSTILVNFLKELEKNSFKS